MNLIDYFAPHDDIIKQLFDVFQLKSMLFLFIQIASCWNCVNFKLIHIRWISEIEHQRCASLLKTFWNFIGRICWCYCPIHPICNQVENQKHISLSHMRRKKNNKTPKQEKKHANQTTHFQNINRRSSPRKCYILYAIVCVCNEE